MLLIRHLQDLNTAASEHREISSRHCNRSREHDSFAYKDYGKSNMICSKKWHSLGAIAISNMTTLKPARQIDA